MKERKGSTKLFSCTQEKVIRPHLHNLDTIYVDKQDQLLLGAEDQEQLVWHGYIEFPHDAATCPIAKRYAQMYTFDKLAHLYDELLNRQTKTDDDKLWMTQSTLENWGKDYMTTHQQIQRTQAIMAAERDKIQLIMEENEQIDLMIQNLLGWSQPQRTLPTLLSHGQQMADSGGSDNKNVTKIVIRTGELLEECKSIVRFIQKEYEQVKQYNRHGLTNNGNIGLTSYGNIGLTNNGKIQSR